MLSPNMIAGQSPCLRCMLNMKSVPSQSIGSDASVSPAPRKQSHTSAMPSMSMYVEGVPPCLSSLRYSFT